ncbi:MAG: SCO family protein, partial [Deinococcales bacterium]
MNISELFIRRPVMTTLVMLGISAVIIVLFYNALQPKKTLPVYQPADFNPELVAPELTHVKKYHTIADFALVNQNGDTITQEDYRDKIYVADFFFTTCPTICPIMTDNMGYLQEQLLDNLERTVRTDADTPVTNVNVNGTFAGSGRLAVSYARADYDSDTSVQESLTGSLASYQILQYFQGLDDSVASNTSNPYWRGGLRLGWDFGDQLTVDVGYQKRHRELE